MIIEQVARITNWQMDSLRTRVYTTMVDAQGQTYVSCVVYNYTPYDRRGQMEPTVAVGSRIDQLA